MLPYYVFPFSSVCDFLWLFCDINFCFLLLGDFSSFLLHFPSLFQPFLVFPHPFPLLLFSVAPAYCPLEVHEQDECCFTDDKHQHTASYTLSILGFHWLLAHHLHFVCKKCVKFDAPIECVLE